MAYRQLSGEETILQARIGDMLRLCERQNRSRFSSFLDERQQMIAAVAAKEAGSVCCRFYGGFPDAERTVLGVFPGYEEPEDGLFPISPISVAYRTQERLSHRDFLGALMGLGLKREAVGDILVEDGRCVLFVLTSVAPMILEDFCKVGRVGVRCQLGAPELLPAAHSFQELSGTVSSLRLDCLVALLTNLSREKSAALIRSGLVQVNGSQAGSASQQTAQGDKLSIRGYGKFLLQTVGSTTKKGRIHCSCFKYL